MKLSRLAVICLTFLLCPVMGAARQTATDDPTYTIDIVAPVPHDGSLLDLDFGVDFPPAGAIQTSSNWIVRVVEYSSGKSLPVSVTTVELVDQGSTRPLPRLHLSQPVDAAKQKITVGFIHGGHYSESSVGQPKPLKRRRFVAAKGKNDAQIYLSGTASAARQAAPLYTVSAKLAYTHPVSIDHAWGWWGVDGTLDAAEESNADPDSITGAAYYLIRLPRDAQTYFRLRIDPARGEFDRKNDNAAFVPSGTALLVFPPRRLGEKSFLAVDLGFGLEGGLSFKNSASPQNIDVFRTVPRADVVFQSFKPWHLSGIDVNANYELRLPQNPEPFTHKVNGTQVTLLGTNPRHHVKTSIDLMFTDFVGLSLSHEYGFLPPAFKLVNNKVSAGLVVKLKQK